MEEKVQLLKQNIFTKLYNLKNLPVMPGLAIELMSYTIDEETSIKELANLISKDPSLTAQILKVSNSAFYALKRKVGSLEQAIILLGLREIKNLIFTLSIIKLFPKKTKFSFDKIAFLKHSVVTGRTAEILTKVFKLNFQTSPFIAGLLHDIGKIFLDQYFHYEFNLAVERAKQDNKNLFEVEAEELGTDHAYIGGYIAKSWNFPEELIDAINFHHCPDEKNKNILLICVVSIADILTNLREEWLTFPHSGLNIFDLKAWKILVENCLIKDFDIERILFEIDDELEKSDEVVNNFKNDFF